MMIQSALKLLWVLYIDLSDKGSDKYMKNALAYKGKLVQLAFSFKGKLYMHSL